MRLLIPDHREPPLLQLRPSAPGRLQILSQVRLFSGDVRFGRNVKLWRISIVFAVNILEEKEINWNYRYERNRSHRSGKVIIFWQLHNMYSKSFPLKKITICATFVMFDNDSRKLKNVIIKSFVVKSGLVIA